MHRVFYIPIILIIQAVSMFGLKTPTHKLHISGLTLLQMVVRRAKDCVFSIKTVVADHRGYVED